MIIKRLLLAIFLLIILVGLLIPVGVSAQNESSGGDDLLPEGYIQVEYVESHGQEWIDTGVVPTKKTRSEVDYQATVEVPASSMGIYGAYKSSRHQVFYSLAPNHMTFGVGKGAYYTSYDTERHYADRS